jgi:hypothetical protein
MFAGDTHLPDYFEEAFGFSLIHEPSITPALEPRKEWLSRPSKADE